VFFAAGAMDRYAEDYESFQSRSRHGCTSFAACACAHAKNIWALNFEPKVLGEIPGKWQVFPLAAVTNRAWDAVRSATIVGRLGFASKCAFEDRMRPAIMVRARIN
jgi:hypothetical protein